MDTPPPALFFVTRTCNNKSLQNDVGFLYPQRTVQPADAASDRDLRDSTSCPPVQREPQTGVKRVVSS